MGYKVTATDAWKLPERDDALESIGAKFFYSNLNHLRPFPLVQDGAFDAILFGEVFEHILNHPLGMLRELRRVLKTGGVMVLTTPNPSTITNAVRVALDLHSPWGFRDFLQSVKVSDDGEIIDNGTIHYREYRTREVVEAVTLAGFAVKTVRYLPFGIAASQPLGKRILKRCFQSVSKNRLLGATQYLVCQAV
jgi:SAM-dependent methyltransferase